MGFLFLDLSAGLMNCGVKESVLTMLKRVQDEGCGVKGYSVAIPDEERTAEMEQWDRLCHNEYIRIPVF